MGPLPRILGLSLLFILQSDDAQGGCPVGFTAFGGVQGCFKVFNNEGGTWFAAKDKCKINKLRMVKPSTNKEAITLREALFNTYGHGTFWLAARADGTQYVWEYDKAKLSNEDPLWFPNLPGGQTNDNYCLTISVNKTNLNNYPENPYGNGPCKRPWYSPICEELPTIKPTPTLEEDISTRR